MPVTAPNSLDYWIFPLATSEAPYQIHIEDIENYHGGDELVIPAVALETFKNVQTTKPRPSFEKLRADHQSFNDKVVLKQMANPFGKGAFAGPAGIVQGSVLVYSGVYFPSKNLKKKSKAKTIYVSDLTKVLDVDGKNVENKSRYFQHLLDDEDEGEASYAKSLFDPPAMENIRHQDSAFYITLQETLYLIPVSILLAKRNIEPDEILGYSYGNSYWNCRAMTPSLFNRAGDPISVLSMRVRNHNLQISQYGISNLYTNIFQTQRFLKYNSETLLVLPPAISVLPHQAANGVWLLALYTVTHKNKADFFYFCMGESEIYFEFKPDLSTTNLPKTMRYLRQMGCLFVDSGNSSPLMLRLPMQVLTKLAVTLAEELFDMLNKVGDCQFSAEISKDYRSSLPTLTSNVRSTFFATSVAVPAAEQPAQACSMQLV
jgi:hypothetical protein